MFPTRLRHLDLEGEVGVTKAPGLWHFSPGGGVWVQPGAGAPVQMKQTCWCDSVSSLLLPRGAFCLVGWRRSHPLSNWPSDFPAPLLCACAPERFTCTLALR